jgi:hypothetical protein
LSYVRTAAHRRLRSQLIRRWRPWEYSTGPRTEQGKGKSSRNAWKGGVRAALRRLSKLLKLQAQGVEEIDEALTVQRRL